MRMTFLAVASASLSAGSRGDDMRIALWSCTGAAGAARTGTAAGAGRGVAERFTILCEAVSNDLP
jgi:hypothetical protein